MGGRIGTITEQDLSTLAEWGLVGAFVQEGRSMFLLKSNRVTSVGILLDGNFNTTKVQVAVHFSGQEIHVTATCVCGSCREGRIDLFNAIADKAREHGISRVVTRRRMWTEDVTFFEPEGEEFCRELGWNSGWHLGYFYFIPVVR